MRYPSDVSEQEDDVPLVGALGERGRAVVAVGSQRAYEDHALEQSADVSTTTIASLTVPDAGFGMEAGNVTIPVLHQEQPPKTATSSEKTYWKEGVQNGTIYLCGFNRGKLPYY